MGHDGTTIGQPSKLETTVRFRSAAFRNFILNFFLKINLKSFCLSIDND